MVPETGEKPAEWWTNTRYAQAVEEQGGRDGGLTGSDDPFVVFYHDVPRAVAEEAMSARALGVRCGVQQSVATRRVAHRPTRFVVCTEDRFFPAEFLRRVVADRLGIVPDEIAAGHCVALSRPEELGRLLDSYARPPVG